MARSAAPPGKVGIWVSEKIIPVMMCPMTDAAPSRGRARELGVIGGLLDGVRQHGGALIVTGEPGIGKSFLIQEAARLAETAGLGVLRTVGVESETALPFAGLHQLLMPVFGAAGALPGTQRIALLTAFGMADGEVPDLHAVALAALELLAEAAAETPLLVIAEDAHWLDRPTCARP